VHRAYRVRHIKRLNFDLKKFVCRSLTAPIASARYAGGVGAILLSVAVGCAGCASQPASPIASAIKPGQAKIVLTPANEGPLLNSVHVAVNGTHVVDLDPGQSYTGGVPAGHVTLIALDIGQYKYEFNAVTGKTYAFQLSRRGEHVAAAILGGLAGLVVETAVSGEQSGEYKITPVQ
jgi:hypothetical protein